MKNSERQHCEETRSVREFTNLAIYQAMICEREKKSSTRMSAFVVSRPNVEAYAVASEGIATNLPQPDHITA